MTYRRLILHTALGLWARLYWIGRLAFQTSHGSSLTSVATCCLVPLTWLITHVSFLLHSLHIKRLQNLWLVVLLSNEALHCAAFVSGSLFSFFLAYEAVLIPLQTLISYWGSGVKRLRASLLFFLYTYTGSTPMLIAVLYLCSFSIPSAFVRAAVFPIACCSLAAVIALWIAFALSFAVKTPLFPFFIWLLFAHAEAPVEGSILLAGVVLKLATFGLVSLLLEILWDGTLAALSFSTAAGAFTMLMASLSLIQQGDLKSYVALRSVAHIANGTLGLLSIREEGVAGALLIGLSHGLVSPSLFLIVGGLLYGGFNTRLIYAYRGLGVALPALAALSLVLLFANMAVPLSPNWISELLILAGLAHGAMVLCCLSSLNVLTSAVYTLWLSGRMLIGSWSSYLRAAPDLRLLNLWALGFFSGLTLLLGLFAQGFTQALISAAWGFAL